MINIKQESSGCLMCIDAPCRQACMKSCVVCHPCRPVCTQGVIGAAKRIRVGR